MIVRFHKARASSSGEDKIEPYHKTIKGNKTMAVYYTVYTVYSTQKYGRFEVCNKGIGSDSDHSTMKQWDSIGNSLSATQFIIWGWDGQEV